jgi:hypothetical protein
LERRLNALASIDVVEDRDGCGYWHAHLPVARSFIDSTAVPRSVRRRCIQALVNASAQLSHASRWRSGECRVLAAISLPQLYDSQLIVFFGEDYWSRFFERNSPEQTWRGLPPNRSLVREWGIRLPQGGVEMGIEESVVEGEHRHRSELWFVGDAMSAPNKPLH